MNQPRYVVAIIGGATAGAETASILADKGAVVTYADPHVPDLGPVGFEYRSQEVTPSLLSQVDCIVITAAHSAFDYKAIVAAGTPIVDTRNALRGFQADHIRQI